MPPLVMSCFLLLFLPLLELLLPFFALKELLDLWEQNSSQRFYLVERDASSIVGLLFLCHLLSSVINLRKTHSLHPHSNVPSMNRHPPSFMGCENHWSHGFLWSYYSRHSLHRQAAQV